MNKYLIEQKVYTYSEIWELLAFDFNGFNFKNWEYGEGAICLGNAWLVKKEVTVPSAIDAMNIFKKGLDIVLIRASFISQCSIQFYVNPFFILKLNDNPDKAFYLHFITESEEVPLHFMEDEQFSLAKSFEYTNDIVFDFLSASNSCLTNHSRLVSLIMALEAIAGEKEVEKCCTQCGLKAPKYFATNKQYIRDEILKDKDLYNKIYAHTHGYRNAVFHGKSFGFTDGVDYADLIYKKIIEYFNTKYGLKINTDVVGAPRNGLGKYGKSNVWAKPKNKDEEISLILLMPMYEEVNDNRFNNKDDLQFGLKFDYIGDTVNFVKTY